MIYIKYYKFKHIGHRTLIVAVLKPWWWRLLFWKPKPLQVAYIGHGSKWHQLLPGGQCIPAIPWLARKLERYEAAKIAAGEFKHKNSNQPTHIK